MGFSVDIEYHPQCELVISLIVFMEPKHHSILELGPDWISTVRSRLSAEVRSEMNALRKLAKGFPLILAVSSPSKAPLDFIQWLEGLTWSDVYEMLAGFKADGFLTKPAELMEWQERICSLLRRWYDLYFSAVEGEIKAHLIRDLAALDRDLPPHELVELLSNGIRLETLPDLQRVILFPQFHGRPFNLYEIGEKTLILGYPCRTAAFWEGDVPADLMRQVKALADENRLRILKLLAQGPRSFSEIAGEMSLAKSTVHHHLAILRAAGLVWVYLSPGRSERYGLRQEALDSGHQQLTEFLLGDRNA